MHHRSTTHRSLCTVALVLGLLVPRAALAHAFLDHAVPGVGSTVSGSPEELQLTFTEAVETALSGVRVTTAAGGYVVHWHAVSVDTHKTSGTYKFTVSP